MKIMKKRRKNFTLTHVYGTAMPLKMEYEKRLLSTSLRLPGLESSNVGLETHQSDIQFDYNDIFVPEEFSVDLHASMEKKLGIQTNLRF